MTVEEMAGQLRFEAPAIPRLDIPAYNWWNEGLHGVAREGRTYRYLREEPLYPFGYGLTYGDIRIKSVEFVGVPDRKKKLRLSVTLKNEGSRRTKDVIQVYIQNEGTRYAPWNPALCGFLKTEAEAGEEKTVELCIPREAFQVVNDAGERILDGTSCTLYVGTSGPDARSVMLTGKQIHKLKIVEN